MCFNNRLTTLVSPICSIPCFLLVSSYATSAAYKDTWSFSGQPQRRMRIYAKPLPSSPKATHIKWHCQCWILETFKGMPPGSYYLRWSLGSSEARLCSVFHCLAFSSYFHKRLIQNKEQEEILSTYILSLPSVL